MCVVVTGGVSNDYGDRGSCREQEASVHPRAAAGTNRIVQALIGVRLVPPSFSLPRDVCTEGYGELVQVHRHAITIRA